MPEPALHRHAFLALDALRGVAAAVVLARHAQPFFGGHAFPASHLAVDFFFMLSGFVIEHASGDRLRQGMGALRFMALRILRLYPLYALATGLGIVSLLNAGAGAPTGPVATALGIGAALLMLPVPAMLSANGYHPYPFDSPAWSLSCEIAASLAYGLAIFRVRGGFLLALLFLSACLLAWVGYAFSTLDAGYNLGNYAGGFGRVCFPFLVGVLLRRAWQSRGCRIPLPPWTCWPACAAMLALLAIPPVGPPALLEFGIVTLAFPALLWFAAGIRAGSLDGLQGYLGRASYGVYVLHAPVFMALKTAFPWLIALLVPLAPWGGIVLATAIFVLAAAIDRWLDAPLRSRLRGLRPRRGNAVAI